MIRQAISAGREDVIFVNGEKMRAVLVFERSEEPLLFIRYKVMHTLGVVLAAFGLEMKIFALSRKKTHCDY